MYVREQVATGPFVNQSRVMWALLYTLRQRLELCVCVCVCERAIGKARVDRLICMLQVHPLIINHQIELSFSTRKTAGRN